MACEDFLVVSNDGCPQPKQSFSASCCGMELYLILLINTKTIQKVITLQTKHKDCHLVTLIMCSPFNRVYLFVRHTCQQLKGLLNTATHSALLMGNVNVCLLLHILFVTGSIACHVCITHVDFYAKY